jgi:hypothetical protein
MEEQQPPAPAPEAGRSHEELKLGIAGFYDRSSKLWEDVWGEHMHHVSSFCRGGLVVPSSSTTSAFSSLF